jgi:Fe(3+) dicitrate transport protein
VFKFDVSAYWLDYQNRIGTIRQQRQDGSFYNFRTNVGGSTSMGAEVFAEASIAKLFSVRHSWGDVSVFASYAYNQARYNSFRVVTVVNNALSEANYRDKRVEYAPENILRSGITYSYKGFSTTLQHSYTDQVFADANNTILPSTNGQNGSIPSYNVFDATVSYESRVGVVLKAGINNLTNENYFTRRSGGYPGPGVLPSDGRTFFLSVGYKMK